LQQALDEQNAAVQRLKDAADKRVEENKKAIAVAKAEAESHKKRAASLLSRVPTAGITVCESADNLFNQEIQNAK
jgi:hypothetical protein